MLRTHLVITALFVVLFIPHVESKIVFAFAALIATLIPDIDTGFSTSGFKTTNYLRFLTSIFTRHRGFIHSLTLCIALTVILSVFLPVLAFGFFLGYSLHIFADSFTISGVQPFWPYKKKSAWLLKTGSVTETSLFVILLLVDILILIVIII
jgi:inner membrane protein